MNAVDTPPAYVLSFAHIFSGKRLVFNCDERGNVDLDKLTERSRTNYLYARAMLGREFLTPEVKLA